MDRKTGQPIAKRGDKPTFFEAIDRVRSNTPLRPSETIPVAAAAGRCLAAPVTALDNYPRFDAAAMDGFAVFAEDAARANSATPIELALAPPLYAGMAATRATTGIAIPISTGAPVPEGVGAILISERADAIASGIRLSETLPPGMNIRRRGEDCRAGESPIGAGRVVNPIILAALISYGVRTVAVRSQPRIAILSTGDEVRSGAGPANGPTIFDSNGPMVAAFLASLGLAPERMVPVADTADDVRRTIAHLASHGTDIIVCSGGVSAGSRDHVRRALDALGATIHFHGVSMRPGKPALFATLPDNRLFFGLPGNPVASAVACRFFLTAAIRAGLGLPPEQGVTLNPMEDGRLGTTAILLARRTVDAGLIHATIMPGQQSHRLRPAIDADSWVVLESPDRQSPPRLFPMIPSFVDPIS